jgi:hypothetical protein
LDKGERRRLHMQKTEIITSLLLIIMGSIDCITTVIGVLYSGAAELNPLMAGIVSTNIGAFLVVKITATMLIAFTYLLANKILMKSQNKSTKSFKYSCKLLRIGYAGIIAFLFIVVANNLLILLA